MAVIVGISCKQMVMVDLDDMSFKRVKRLALKAVKYFKLDGFVVLKLSCNHYHVVFDKPVWCWSKILEVVALDGYNG
ncbi:MAG: hypothetical protein QXO71_03365 [Candidatus Jordarchaeaceae archaeon]